MAKRWLFLEIAKAWSAAFGFFSLHFPRSPELLQWGQDAEIPTYPFFPFMDLFMNLSVCLFEPFDTLCSQLCVAASTRCSLSALSREVFPLCVKWISLKFCWVLSSSYIVGFSEQQFCSQVTHCFHALSTLWLLALSLLYHVSVSYLKYISCILYHIWSCHKLEM